MLACSMTPIGMSTEAATMPARERGAFQLLFRSLFNAGRGYSFPCDARGCVEMDQLSDRARINYLFARAVVGRDLHVPEVVPGARLCWADEG
jgi:hypothetical protein